MADVRINDELSIPEGELRFTASRSGGPGGQHANKVASRVTLNFDVEGSPTLSSDQKERIGRRLANRINNDGVLQVDCDTSRSQAANRAEATERFAELLRDALRKRKRRVPTRPGKAARERRLKQKKQRGDLKRSRRTPRLPDDA